MEERMQQQGIYPVRDGVDLATTCMQTMMDANLALQIRCGLGRQSRAPDLVRASTCILAPKFSAPP
eukprot:scaffold11399_cov62-Isochrysis_galbana.AAC.1